MTATVVLVHGAFAGSDSWEGVIEGLQTRGITAIAVANPLRSLAGDAAYVRDVVASVGGPVVLVGHSYGGLVITQAAADASAVQALVYVGAFAPAIGESAFELSGKFPGSTLAEALEGYPLADGGVELRIAPAKFPAQFAADLAPERTTALAATQRPVTEAALRAGLDVAGEPWRTVPSWFVWGAEDRNIPAELVRYMAERAGARQATEVPGASHALAVSRPAEVTATILAAVDAV
ncbi:MAG: alpha/beta hydrolase [Promicromonosporaceae bacterium]|nr:alpha/beta hydrolase [Promicromonosporaceae bacterium]